MKKLLLFLIISCFSFSFTAFAKWEGCRQGYGSSEKNGISVYNNGILISTKNSGLLYSSDNGTSWTTINPGLKELSIEGHAVKGNYIFARTVNKGIFRLNNINDKWLPVNKGLPNLVIQDLIVNDDLILAIVYNMGIFISTDNGDTWLEKNEGIANKMVRSITCSGMNLFAVTYDNSVFYSSNYGNSWKESIKGIYPGFIKTNGKKTFIMCEEYIYYSSNLGQTWERKDMTYYDPFFSIIEFVIHDDILFACYHEQGIAYSTDNGDSWIKITDGPERFFADNTDCRIVEMLFIEKSLFVLTNYFGLHSTSDLGKTWISKIPSTSNFFINSILSVGNNIVATGNKGLLISSDGGSIWSEKNNEIFKRSNGLYFVNGISCLVNKGNNIYAAYFGKIYLTTDLGDSWNLIENGKNGSTRYLAISGDNIVGGQGDAGGGVIVSTDLGKTWAKKYQDETNQVAIKGNSIFASSEDNGLLLSTDLGNTWTKKHDYNYIKFISLLDKKEGYDIFFGCSYNLFFSSNYGSTWSSPENSKFQEVFSFTSKGNKLFLGCESVLNSSGLINLFFSSDYGKSWNDMSDGSKGATILSLTIIGDYIYAGTKKSGITRCNLSDFGIAGIEDNIISSNSLNIFPQPVKDKLTFLLNEDIQQNSSLEIFDMMGRTVFTMANINTKEIEINAQFFSTGIYYCRLLNGNKVHTSKFQVIK